MKHQITLITLLGLTCATIAYGAELSFQGQQFDTRSLAERANKMMMHEPSMHHLMTQMEHMQKQMNVLHETLRRNHTRRNLFSVRNMKDAVEEMNRNMNSLHSQISRFISAAGPSTLGTRSFGGADQQNAASSASSSGQSFAMTNN